MSMEGEKDVEGESGYKEWGGGGSSGGMRHDE